MHNYDKLHNNAAIGYDEIIYKGVLISDILDKIWWNLIELDEKGASVNERRTCPNLVKLGELGETWWTWWKLVKVSES